MALDPWKSGFSGNVQMSNSPFKVSIRLIESNSALLAKANVQGAKMNLNGFSVIAGKGDKGPWVIEPSFMADSGFVKAVEIHNKALKDTISKLILEEYEKAVTERESAQPCDLQEPAF